jgi:hypothetical protein
MIQTVTIEELKPFIGKLPDEFIYKLENFLINKTDLSSKERVEFFEILSLLVK